MIRLDVGGRVDPSKINHFYQKYLDRYFYPKCFNVFWRFL